MTDDPVWHAHADNGIWSLSVFSEGRLKVERIRDGLTILNVEVPLGEFVALLGPDQDDVNLWATMSIEAIDHFNRTSVTEDGSNHE